MARLAHFQMRPPVQPGQSIPRAFGRHAARQGLREEHRGELGEHCGSIWHHLASKPQTAWRTWEVGW